MPKRFIIPSVTYHFRRSFTTTHLSQPPFYLKFSIPRLLARPLNVGQYVWICSTFNHSCSSVAQAFRWKIIHLIRYPSKESYYSKVLTFQMSTAYTPTFQREQFLHKKWGEPTMYLVPLSWAKHFEIVCTSLKSTANNFSSYMLDADVWIPYAMRECWVPFFFFRVVWITNRFAKVFPTDFDVSSEFNLRLWKLHLTNRLRFAWQTAYTNRETIASLFLPQTSDGIQFIVCMIMSSENASLFHSVLYCFLRLCSNHFN